MTSHFVARVRRVKAGSGSGRWPSGRGPLMVGIVFLAQNCALAMASGVFGVALATIQSDFRIGRGLASSALGVTFLAFGLLSPVAGYLLRYLTIRAAMTAGAILSACGYLIVANASSFTQCLLAYGLLIGPGASLLGPVTGSTLISRWYERDRGMALGIANMPVFLLIAPPIAAQLIVGGGRVLVFSVYAALFLALVPLIRLIAEPPEAAPAAPTSERLGETADADDGAQPWNGKRLLQNPRFWVLSIGIGILSGTATAFVTHAASIALLKHVELTAASALVASFGAGTLVGGLLFGWLIDRIGALPALFLNAAGQAVLWAALIPFASLPALMAVSGLLGCCGGATVALHSATLNRLFGPANFSLAMGLSYFLKVPFLFGFPPLAGYLFDLFGNYDAALLVNVVAIGAAAAMFLLLLVHVGAGKADSARLAIGSSPG